MSGVIVSILNTDSSGALLINLEGVSHASRFLEVPVGNHDGVGSSRECEVGLSNGDVVHGTSQVASWDFEATHSWESCSLEEEGVDEVLSSTAILLESWVLSLQGEVNNLSRWYVNRDRKLFYRLSHLEELCFSELLVNRSCR